MSVMTADGVGVETVDRGEGTSRRRGSRLGGPARLVGLLVRLAIGGLLCFHPLLAIIPVGWTHRLMRRRIWRGWWDSVPFDERPELNQAMRELGLDVVRGRTPRWFLSEEFRQALGRPGRDGREPGFLRKLARLPGALTGSLRKNLGYGVSTLACTYALTLPGCFLWWAAWYDGWNTSFNKGYENSAVGAITWFAGSFLFIAAMMYVPMAWAHHAATGDARAFFQFGVVTRLIRKRLAATVLFAACFALACAPIIVLRVMPSFLPQMIDLEVETATPETIQSVANTFILVSGLVAFLLYVMVHLFAARLYRPAVLKLLNEDPGALETLPPVLKEGLIRLGLVSEVHGRLRHPLIRVVVGTARLSVRVALSLALFLLWAFIVFEILVSEFLIHRPISGWLNQQLVHLPSLFFQTNPGG